MADGLSWDVFTVCGVDVDVTPVLNTDIWLTGAGQRRASRAIVVMCNQKEECGTVTDSVVLGYLLSQL